MIETNRTKRNFKEFDRAILLPERWLHNLIFLAYPILLPRITSLQFLLLTSTLYPGSHLNFRAGREGRGNYS